MPQMNDECVLVLQVQLSNIQYNAQDENVLFII